MIQWRLSEHMGMANMMNHGIVAFPKLADKPIYGDGSKPWYPGEHQNSWYMDVHPTKNGINRY